MCETVERYVVTVRKALPEERNVFKALPEDRQRSYQEVHPGEVGQRVSYSLDLAEEDVGRVRRAGNLIDLVRISDHGTGYRPHDDPQDKYYRASASLQDTPAKAGVRRNEHFWARGPILDQGEEGACTGFSARAFLNADPIMTSPGSGPSAGRIFHEARRVDEWAGEDYDWSSINAACKVLRSYGYINQYYWAESFEEIRDWLLYRGGVILGLDWYEGCYQTDAQWCIHPTGRLETGHAIFARGMNKDGHIYLQNSWGSGYGWNGEAWLLKSDLLNVFMRSDSFEAACTVQVR